MAKRLVPGERILSVVYDVPYPWVEGGGQKRLYEIARRLVGRGWKVKWYCFQAWTGENITEKDGLTFIGLARLPRLYARSGRRSISEALLFGLKVWQARGMIASSNIMWCGQWPYFHLFALAGKTASVDRMVIDWWETWDEHWLEYLGHLGVIGRFVERSSLKVLNGDARIVTNSEMGRRDILRIGAPSDAVKVIHNGISLKDIFAEPPYSEQVDIIFCGRLKNHKNVDHLLKALDILKDNGMTYTLDIIGDGPERVFLEQLAATLGLARTVRFLGVIKSSAEVYRRMKSAKLYVNPSTKEGGGSIALFEANACGLPAVIYKHTHGIDNALIAEGKNGLIVETVTPAGLAECIQTLLSQPLQLKKMSMESVEIAKEYDWERITASYEELFFT